ncbi:hypothetical protein AVEN_170657-1 [Araneus ventricosus]|uniref:Uncharacterized protein n=1 Tax=Araneus ventricosus TaxID=182803 RepID=A0A4Y2MGR2_ARAVE|nr:hypothetical protein AVEN_170657-1 [Araneus ventricosus]
MSQISLIVSNLDYFVTNMESRFPGMSVLWLGREFDRGKYGMTSSKDVWSLTLATILATWRQTWRLWRRNMGSQRCWNLLYISIQREDTLECTRSFHVTSRPAGETI